MKKKEFLSIERLISCGKRIEDPRRESGNFRHLLIDILIIGMLAILSGCETWEEIADYGQIKSDWLKSFLELPHGVPGEATYRRLFIRLTRSSVESIYREWVGPYIGGCLKKQICIDGKTVRGVANGSGSWNHLHMLSAWVREDGITLGQISVDTKENEIVAIPKLLETLDVRGAIVSIDAMGCQRAIAEKVISCGAQYILAVKGNQPTLQTEIAEYFRWAEADSIESKQLSVDVQVEWTHGRNYRRRTVATSAIHWFESKKEWIDLRSFVMVERKRVGLESTSFERHYYISSLEASAIEFARYIRGHWAIENNLHWMLDTTFHEDRSLIHTGHAPVNLSLLRKIAMAILHKDNSSNLSTRRKQRLVAYSDQYAFQLLSEFK